VSFNSLFEMPRFLLLCDVLLKQPFNSLFEMPGA